MLTESGVTLIASGLAFTASVIAVIASIYNSRFGRFKSERWWERKIEAYSRIIEAISDLVYYYQQSYNAEIYAIQHSDEKRLEINAHWNKGNLEIRKASNVGAFIISQEAEEILKEYWNRTKEGLDSSDWFGRLEFDYTSAEACLKKFVICAKKDLRV